MQFEQLGPYRVGRRLGRGGMGEVYAGQNVETGEPVALKVLHPSLALAEGFRERFEAEIESLRKLNHPNIVRLLGHGEQDGFLFYSMELVRGRSLEDELTAGRRFDWHQVTNIGIKLCKALKHAHDHGIIHRDLKPANLLLTEDGDVKLLDFGIARLFGQTHLTSAGGVLGTADYMSPEQADGRPVTERCDQYSLGGVMYALAAGRPPFLASSLPELLQLHRFSDPPPLRRFAPEIPSELESIILQLLAKDPEKRFPNVMVLARHMTAMSRALSRPTKETKKQEQEIEVLLDDAGPVAESVDLLGATRIQEAEDLTSVPEITHAPAQPARGQTPRPLGGTKTNATTTAPRPPRRSHFTTVEEELLREQETPRGAQLLLALQVAGLASLLAALVGAIWYAFQPLSADALYERIIAAQDRDGAAGLLEVEPQLTEFTERFPHDERISQINQLREEADLASAARKLRTRARFARGTDDLRPVERMYIQAARLAEENPELGAARIQALVDLYAGEEENLSAAERHCLAVAARQLADLRAQIADYAPTQLQALRERLAQAQRLRETDPHRAARIYRAVLVLAGDHSWASETAREAAAGLQSLGPLREPAGAETAGNAAR